MRYRFGEHTLDLEASRLLGPEGEIRLRPQAFRMLEVLAESAPKILSQEALLDQVWGVEHLSPASVKQAISEVRQALGDDPSRPRIIETVHRRGYRFIAPIERIDPAPPPSELATQPLPMSKVLAKINEVLPPSPPPVRTGRRLAIALLVPLLAGLAVVTLLGLSRPDRAAGPARATAPPAASPSGRRAVAILAFRNLSAHPQDAWISPALGEILGFELTAPGRLRVIPADNVERMRRELGLGEDEAAPASLARIGRNLGTSLVVTGSYLVSRPAGASDETRDKIRIQLMVQDIRSGETIAWARETGAREELLDLATAAARGLLGSLGSRGEVASQPGAAALAANAESLRLWSEAAARLRVRDAMAAVPLLQRAESIDPDNPFVHDALAASWSRLGFDGKAAAAAGKALALAEGLPREIRLRLEARAHDMRFEPAEAAQSYAELWRLFPDNLEYGLGLAAAQTQSGAAESSLTTLEAMRKLPPPDGADPRIDLAEFDAAWGLGDFARCRDAAQRAVQKAEARSATVLLAMGRVSRGWALSRLGQGDAALADFRAAGAIYRRMGDRGAAAGARAAEALIHQSQGKPAEARQIYEEVLPVLHEIGDRTREAKTLNNFAALVGGAGDKARATELLERSLAIKREIEDLQGTATTLVNLGNLREIQGDARGARPYLEEAIGLSRRLGDSHGTALALRGISRVHVREGHFDAGRAALDEGLGLCRQTGDVEGLAQTELVLASLEQNAGRLDEARDHYEKSLALWMKLKDQETVAEVRAELAKLGGREGREHAGLVLRQRPAKNSSTARRREDCSGRSG
ncbi:MAG TPA: tetratricopeptide repeat protein [Thermoanaerobaculia bacterium]|nr:tetratricopeptide repeat protein [Thermoanaerobaculia bacterium]